MKKAFIGTAALIGLLVAMEFIAPGHWGFLTEYISNTFQSMAGNFGFM